ncbi:VacJ family lipoprotein [Alishewanella sp. HH-ZS]|jgi:phospholipid-binding lipoprotein MlaA|uniref:MlaA family lipoprotein n=1 Tax=Alishewanella sp. HH-ZS TaxID=1856684 RepID=UPI0008236055|nr:VacJ family lipoprotein [Alishewanella sp. HH-ZS]OCW97642.1 ABC transporter [Alishewanella sp. HH-ZS]
MLSPIKSVALLLTAVLLTGCASSKQAEQQAATAGTAGQQAPKTVVYDDPRDPWERVNRPLFDFNLDVLDEYLLRPATVGYMTIVPKPARKGLKNVVDNLGEPASFLNSVLQAKPEKAAVSAGRFLVNSTVGIVGLFDVARKMGLEPADEDFNQTLAVWGVGDGPYLMVPARGPTTIRGTAGGIVDNLYFPLGLLNTPLTLTRAAIMALDAREELMQVEDMLNNSLDPYSFVKEAYFQRQRFKIYDGNPPPPEETLDDDTLDFLDEIE